MDYNYRLKNEDGHTIGMAAALRKYNDTMFYCLLEHRTVNTWFSEIDDKYTLRDMVNECEIDLQWYSESGHMRCISEADPEDRPRLRKERKKLQTFIKKYKPWVLIDDKYQKEH